MSHEHADPGYKFCPRCGAALALRLLKEDEPPRLVCGGCGFVFYQNPKVAACTISVFDGGIVLLEAGTGVGKSFAYLVPALRWAHANGERTIVSTNTINLQEQLVARDLPLLRDALGDDDWRPTFALLKGWRNYLCLARLELAAGAQQSLLEEAKLEELASLAEWASRTARLAHRVAQILA